MYHYVYRITNQKLNKHYYGVRSSKIHPKLDLGVKYFSSSYNKKFIEEQKILPKNFKYKIIMMCDTRAKALSFEIKLHNKFDVGVNPYFYNYVKQTAKSFDCSGITLSEEHKSKIGKKHKGKLVSDSTKELISKNHADVSGCNNPMFGKQGTMKGKIAVVLNSTLESIIITTAEYHTNRFLYTPKNMYKKFGLRESKENNA